MQTRAHVHAHTRQRIDHPARRIEPVRRTTVTS